MTELSGAAIAHLQTFASAGLVVCLVLSGAFTALAFATHGEQERRHAALAAERVERISQLLAENAPRRVAVVDEIVVSAPVVDEEDEYDEQADVPLFADLADSLRAMTPVQPGATLPADVIDSLPDATDPVPVPPEDVLAMLTPLPARRLEEAEASALALALDAEAGGFSVEIVTAPETESRLFGMQLADALRRAGLDARGPVAVLTTIGTPGLLVSTGGGDDAGARLLSAMQSTGLPALPPQTGSAQSDILLPDGTDVRVYVGDMSLKPDDQERPQDMVRTARLLEDA